MTTRVGAPTLSLIIPVYRSEATLPALMDRLDRLNQQFQGNFEAVCVVDGSPDASYAWLRRTLPVKGFRSQLVAHSRNFGSFAAIRTGMERASGDFIATMAADLQEPEHLVSDFYDVLCRDEADVVVGVRAGRADARGSMLASSLFWWCYRRFVQREMPPGGIDMMGCNRQYLESLLSLRESNSSLVGLAIWLGYRRAEVSYERAARSQGVSGWSFRRKLRYMGDSTYSFTDLPIRLLTIIGAFGLIVSFLLGVFVITARAMNVITVPGYAATILVISFFAAMNLVGLGIIGTYVWRAFENTKARPSSVVMFETSFDGVHAGGDEVDQDVEAGIGAQA